MTRLSNRRLASISLLLAACTTSGQDHPGSTAVATPQIPINGNYNAMMMLTRGSANSCGTQDMTIFRVKNGSIHHGLNQPRIPWRPQVVFDVAIMPDGSFQTGPGPTYLRGQLKLGHMQGEIAGDACGYQFEADRGGTW